MGEKIFRFFKKVFCRRSEFERKLALLEIEYKHLKEQCAENSKRLEALEKKTVSQLTVSDEDCLSYNQIINEWLNGEEKNNEQGAS